MKLKINNGKYINLIEENLRLFKIITNSTNILIRRDDNYRIITVIFEDSFTIKLNDTIKTENNKYFIREIKYVDGIFYCYQESVTKTSKFIMPFLGGNHTHYDFSGNFYNSYLSEDFNKIYLVYKFSDKENYINMEGEFTKNPNFIRIIDPSPELVVIEFKIPEIFLSDVKKIMEGKYTSISAVAKTKILTFHSLSNKSRTFRILAKDKNIRSEIEMELGCKIPEHIDLISKPVEEEEVWTFQNILNKVGTKY